MMGARRSGHMTLVVEGSFLTKMGRDIMLQGDAGRAFRLLSHSLVGEGSVKAAEDILDGLSKLVGGSTEGLSLEPDDSPSALKYRTKIQKLFAGRHEFEGCWFRPQARVVGPPRQDVSGFRDGMLGQVFQDIAELAAFECLLPGERVFVAPGLIQAATATSDALTTPAVFIGAACSPRPHWWVQYSNTREAYADFLAKGGELKIRDSKGLQRARRLSKDQLKREVVEAGRQADEASTGQFAALHRGEELERASLAAQIETYRKEILKQAGDDFFMLDVRAEEEALTEHVCVPRAPFLRWAYKRLLPSQRGHVKLDLPEWQNVCPSGLKLPFDDANHSDWMVGAGIPLEYSYDSKYSEAAYRAVFELSRGPQRGIVIVQGPTVTGRVGKEICVLPNLSTDHLDRVLAARAVIAETGGQLCHLAQVSLDRNIPIMLVEHAMHDYEDGMVVEVDTVKGTVRNTLRSASELGLTQEEQHGSL